MHKGPTILTLYDFGNNELLDKILKDTTECLLASVMLSSRYMSSNAY